MGLAEEHIRTQFRAGEVFVTLSAHGSGHQIGSAYVDLLWTPIVGPGVMALARWAQYRLRAEQVTRVSVAEICEALGRATPGRACQIVTRAVQFHVADVVENDADFLPLGYVLQFRRGLPTLSEQRIQQLSPGLALMHEQYLAEVAS